MASKEYDYVVTIKSNNVFLINIISILLLAIAFTVFVYIGFRLLPYHFSDIWKPFAVAAFILIWVLIRYVAIKKPYYRLALFVAGVYFFFSPLGFSWIGFLYIIAGLLEKPAKATTEFGFDKTGITTNAIIPKHFDWNELQNVLIKDNLLTIDFKNNKIYQKELQNSISGDLEKEFNMFCINHLKENSSK